MSREFRGVEITPALEKWARAVWGQLNAWECTASLHYAAGYSWDSADAARLLDWQELGQSVRDELVIFLLRFENILRKAHR